MSRIVVKNLPKKITVQKLRQTFSEKGQVTDVQPKYTKAGKFRQFAFIGYKTEAEAQAAKIFFHNSFIQTSKIKVDICHSLGENTVKGRSKHPKKVKGEPNSKEQAVNHKKTSPEEKNNAKLSWCDDGDEPEDSGIEKGMHHSGHEDDSGSDEADGSSDKDDPSAKKKISDTEVKKPRELFTVKVKKMPFSCKKKHLKAFFHPLKAVSIRIPSGRRGFAYVGFSTEKDMKRALNKHRGFLDGHMVDVVCYKKKEEQVSQENAKENMPEGDPVELIAETGRIFVRNLCFSVNEQDLKKHFSRFGPIADLQLPVDFYTKQVIGYALITYVFPEHAVKAFSELDGTDFQGRMLHVLPGQPKREFMCDPNEMTFKEKKAAKQKSLAHSSHNWNVLFLGQNAVIDVMAKEYDVAKADILSSETKESAAVRMALGETQLVVETRKFLLQHGVKLDAFSQAAGERSSTVILAKNLPARTSSLQLQSLFSKFGRVTRVILPPCGITALVEFQEPSEAKKAFNKLAYSRLINKPLYLEWAPVDVFSAEPVKENVDTSEENDTSQVPEGKDAHVVKQDSEEEEKEHDNDVPPEGTTLFVKNINFGTTEESLKKHFKVCGPLCSVTISKKKDLKSGKLLSMGFGFVQYKKKSSAQAAIQDLQLVELDGHALELKYSNRATVPTAVISRKKNKIMKESTKICVKNIPFEASKKEIQDLFEQFGELKFVRLPKQTSTNKHRGFGFVDFVRKKCAKKAFETLCHSTHLLGRKLVLEWALPDAEDVDTLRKRTARDSHHSEPERVKKVKLVEDALLAKVN